MSLPLLLLPAQTGRSFVPAKKENTLFSGRSAPVVRTTAAAAFSVLTSQFDTTTFIKMPALFSFLAGAGFFHLDGSRPGPLQDLQ